MLREDLEKGTVHTLSGGVPVSTKPWVPHKVLEGVSLRTLASGAETAGALTCLMVRVEPGRGMTLHQHDKNLELHEVIEGSGTLLLQGQERAYSPGCLAVIPPGVPHEVRAGKDGLCLLAKFVPAL